MKALWKTLFALLLIILILQVAILNLLTYHVCPRFCEFMMNKLLSGVDPQVLSQLPQVVLGANALTQLVVPAAQALHQEAVLESDHRRKTTSDLLKIISKLDPKDIPDLLETIQRQEYEGVVNILDSVFTGYSRIMDTAFEGMVAVEIAGRAPPENLSVTTKLGA